MQKHPFPLNRNQNIHVYVHFQIPLITKRIAGLFRAIYESYTKQTLQHIYCICGRTVCVVKIFSTPYRVPFIGADVGAASKHIAVYSALNGATLAITGLKGTTGAITRTNQKGMRDIVGVKEVVGGNHTMNTLHAEVFGENKRWVRISHLFS